MNFKNELTKNDAIFYMDMVDSGRSPNYKPKLYKVKPYIRILNKRNSEDFQRFIGIYKVMKYTLSEREIIILDEIYGVDKESATLKTVAQLLNISPERVRQIRNMAEHKISMRLSVKLKDYLL